MGEGYLRCSTQNYFLNSHVFRFAEFVSKFFSASRFEFSIARESVPNMDHSKSDGEQLTVKTPARKDKSRVLKRQPVLDESSDSGSDETDIWDLDVCRSDMFHKLYHGCSCFLTFFWMIVSPFEH